MLKHAFFKEKLEKNLAAAPISGLLRVRLIRLIVNMTLLKDYNQNFKFVNTQSPFNIANRSTTLCPFTLKTKIQHFLIDFGL